jgi:hypothetical protein
MATRKLLHLFALCVIAGLASCGGGDAPAPAPVSNPPPPPPPPPPLASVTLAGCVAGTQTLSIVSGNRQSAAPGAQLPERPTARLTCESSANRGTTAAVVGETIHWNVGSRGRIDGSQSTLTLQTDSGGNTSVAWTLGSNFSAQHTGAYHSVPNRYSSVEFQASVTPTTTSATSCQDAGGTDHGATTVVAADQAWRAADSPHRGGMIRLDNETLLSVEAGAVVCLGEIDGLVVADGRAQAPIRFFGTSLPKAQGLSYVRAENALKVGSPGSPVSRISDSAFTRTSALEAAACAQVAVGSGGAWIVRSVISGYGSADCAAMHVMSEPSLTSPGYYDETVSINARILNSVRDAIFIADRMQQVALYDCEVSGSGRHGVVVPPSVVATGGTPPGMRVRGCNLFGNGGDAINNSFTFTVNAANNWWGDPAGPAGPNGDGVSGNVDAGLPLATPATLGY